MNRNELISALGAPEPQTRIGALKEACESGLSDLPDILLPLLGRESFPRIRAIMVRVIGQLGTPPQVVQLIPFLQDSSPEVRLRTIQALPRAQTTDHLTTLVVLLGTDSDAGVKDACATTLRSLGRETLLALFAQMVQGPDATMCRGAIKAMSLFHSPLVVPLLARGALRPEEQVRREAIEGLQWMAGLGIKQAQQALDYVQKATAGPAAVESTTPPAPPAPPEVPAATGPAADRKQDVEFHDSYVHTKRALQQLVQADETFPSTVPEKAAPQAAATPHVAASGGAEPVKAQPAKPAGTPTPSPSAATSAPTPPAKAPASIHPPTPETAEASHAPQRAGPRVPTRSAPAPAPVGSPSRARSSDEKTQGSALATLYLIAAMLPMFIATLESLHAGTQLRWALLGADVALAGAILVGWRSMGGCRLAGLVLVVWSAICSMSLLMDESRGSAVLLMGLGQDFWACAMALVALVPPAMFLTRRLTGALRVVPALAVLGLGSGFIVGMLRGLHFADLIGTAAALSFLPAPYLQPGWICVGAVFPVLAAGALLIALKGLATKDGSLAWSSLCAAFLLVWPAGAGSVLLSGRGVPSLVGLVTGGAKATARPAAGTNTPAEPLPPGGPPASPSGSSPEGPPHPAEAASTVAPIVTPLAAVDELDLTYQPSSTDKPAAPRKLVIKPAGKFSGGVPMAAFLHMSPTAGESPAVHLYFRPGGKAPDALSPTDLDLREDGARRTIESVTSRPTGGRDARVVLVVFLHDKPEEYNQRCRIQLARFLAGFPATTRLTYAVDVYWEPGWEWKHAETRDDKAIYDLMSDVGRSGYQGKLQGFEAIPRVLNALDIGGLKDRERFFVLVQELPKDRVAAKPDAEMISRFQTDVTGLMVVGGLEGGPNCELARLVGGCFIPGEDLKEWSKGLDAVRAAIDYDFVVKYH